MFVLEDRDSEELVLVLQGYFSLLTERELTVNYIKSALDETREYPSLFGSPGIVLCAPLTWLHPIILSAPAQ